MGNYLRIVSICSYLSVIIISTAFTFLVGFLLWKGVPTLDMELFFGDTQPIEAIFNVKHVWDGLWPAVIGTLELIMLTACIVIVPGIACGVFLAEYASHYQHIFIRTTIDILAGTPSIVMGLFGFTFILFLRNIVSLEVNTGLFLAALCLALLVLPVLVMATQESLLAVSKSLRLTAYTLGYTREQFLLFIQIPAAFQGIWSGLALALSRVAEDTAVILLTGAVVNAGLPSGLGSKFEALPFVIYHTATQYQTEDELNRGFGAALVLLILVVGLFVFAQILASYFYRLRKEV